MMRFLVCLIVFSLASPALAKKVESRASTTKPVSSVQAKEKAKPKVTPGEKAGKFDLEKTKIVP